MASSRASKKPRAKRSRPRVPSLASSAPASSMPPTSVTITRDLLITGWAVGAVYVLFRLLPLVGEGVWELRLICYGILGGAASRFGLGDAVSSLAGSLQSRRARRRA